MRGKARSNFERVLKKRRMFPYAFRLILFLFLQQENALFREVHISLFQISIEVFRFSINEQFFTSPNRHHFPVVTHIDRTLNFTLLKLPRLLLLSKSASGRTPTKHSPSDKLNCAALLNGNLYPFTSMVLFSNLPSKMLDSPMKFARNKEFGRK